MTQSTSSRELQGSRRHLPAVIAALRPRQWLKNLLVYAAPLAAGRLFEPSIAGRATLAALAFVLCSSAVYLINDVSDVEEDRKHPRKRLRPIAAGDLQPRTAVIVAVALLIAGLGLGLWLGTSTGVTLVVYLAAQAGYTWGLKKQPVIDLALVASGFMIRAIAGGVATGIVLSPWFLMVTGFGSLFMVAGKRYSEIVTLGPDAGTRSSLQKYTPSYLRMVWMMACALVIMSYSLWAFTGPTNQGTQRFWVELSIVPFTLALMRYAMDIDAAEAGSPEEVAIRDRTLQVLAAIWLVLVLVGGV